MFSTDGGLVSPQSVLRKCGTRFEFRRDVLIKDLNLMLFGKRFV